MECRHMDADDYAGLMWHSVGVLLVVALAALLLALTLSDKHVDGYYLSQGQRAVNSACVYAHWTWHSDELAYCTDDKEKALDFVNRANQALRAK